MIYAAGILLMAPTGRVLFLRRSLIGDHAGEWALPGGKIEDNEDASKAAVRECYEETGYRVGSPDRQLVTTETPECHFTTFFKQCDEEFTPKLNDEHTAFMWMTPDEALAVVTLPPPPPEPVLPAGAN